MSELQSQDDLIKLDRRYCEASDAPDGSDERVQVVIDALDEALEQTQAGGALYGRAVQMLREWCRTSGRLPSSCTLAVNVELESPGRSSSSSTLSDVYRGHSSGILVAVKALRVHVDDHEIVRKSLKNEAVVWKFLRHPNIVPFFGISERFPVCIVSGWMSQGTISSFFSEHPTQSRSPYISQILSGLEFMHSLGVVHGGLKSNNILVDGDQNARLADSGLATVLFNASSQLTSAIGESVGGTIRFMAPELLSEGTNFTVMSDIYALSITIWELFAQETPYSHVRNDRGVVIKVLAGERPTRPAASANVGFTEEVWDAMQRGWGQEPELRPALSEFLQAVAPGMALRRDSALDPRQRLPSERKRTPSIMKEAPGTGDIAPLLHEPAVSALDEAVQQPIAALDGHKNEPDPSRTRVVEVSRKGDAHLQTAEPRRKRRAEGVKTEDVEAQRSAPKSKRLIGTLRRLASEVGPNLGRVQIVEAEKARRRHEETAATTRQEMVPKGKRARSMENMGTSDTALLPREPAAEGTQQPAAAPDDSRPRLDAPDLTSVPIAEAKKAPHQRENGPWRELPATVVPRAALARQDTDVARALVLEDRPRKQAEEEKAMLQTMERDRKMAGCCSVQRCIVS